MPKQEWEEELPRLRTSFDGETESILKFSYDALCDEDQALFLHLACFFNIERIEKVEAQLAEIFPGRLRVLAEKSLISISYSGLVEMHDLLRRLGKEIVRKQSINEPGKRQFLVDARDICQVLRNDSVGSPSVIGIDLDYSELGKELKISDGAFERMSNLQFLRLRHYGLPSSVIIETLSCLPPKVRLLHWDRFPKTCLPCNFNPEFLVELYMPWSDLEKLWEGIKVIRNLKWMNLSHSKNLKELPDLSTATNLEELYLSGCSSLVELPFSIGNAINLQELDLSECSSLVELPSSIGNAINLQNLNLSKCSSLVELLSSIGNMSNLEELDLCDWSSVVELPSSIGNLHNLQKWYLKGCSKLKALPININMRSLDDLNLHNCLSLKSFPEISTNITFLKLKGTAIQEIPPSIRSWSRLDTLLMPYSENLSKSMHAFDLITELHLSDTRIQEIAPWVKEMSRLHTLLIKGCTKLVSLPQLPDSLEILKAQNCECESLERLDCSFKETSSLYKLVIKGCTKLKLVSLPQLPDSLAILVAQNCESLERLQSLKLFNNCSIRYKMMTYRLNFVNCFKLNQEARDLIIKTSTTESAAFPGETVPTYFTYRATGTSLSMKLNGSDTFCPTTLRFKACVLLVPKGDVEADDMAYYISCKIKEKLNGAIVASGSPDQIRFEASPTLKEHLYVFEFEETVSSTELVFEFKVSNPECEIKECGLRTLETYAPSC